MTDIANIIIDWLVEIMLSIGPSAGFFIVILESIIPILPLAVFIALNKISYGAVTGIILSWIGTITGCMISFYIFRKGFSKYLYKDSLKDSKVVIWTKKIANMNFTTLVLLLALPFTPAFAVNIAAGLSKISPKTFLLALLISKISIVYFWGFIGTSFVESIQNPIIILQVIAILIITYFITIIVNGLFKIERKK